MTASILEYRQFKGRTYHSDRHVADYTIPNDEQQLESMDLTYVYPVELVPLPSTKSLCSPILSHHYLSLTLDGALYLAPIGNDVQVSRHDVVLCHVCSDNLHVESFGCRYRKW